MQPHRFTRLAVAVRRLRHLFQRRRQRSDRRRLSGGRGADRGRRQGASRRRHRRARPPPRPRAARAGGDRAAGAGLARPGDIVVFLGAGTITQWAYALPANSRRSKETSIDDGETAARDPPRRLRGRRRLGRASRRQLAVNDDGADRHLGFDACTLTDHEDILGGDLAFETAVDANRAFKCELAFK